MSLLFPEFRILLRTFTDSSEISDFCIHFVSLGLIRHFPGYPARKKLLGDAIGSRFGAMSVQINHKTVFLEGPGATL